MVTKRNSTMGKKTIKNTAKGVISHVNTSPDKKLAGLVSMKGEVVTIFCGNYIYTGKLLSVTKRGAMLQDCGIVYETGDFDSPEWKDVQKLNADWCIAATRIESWGLMKGKSFPKNKASK